MGKYFFCFFFHFFLVLILSFFFFVYFVSSFSLSLLSSYFLHFSFIYFSFYRDSVSNPTRNFFSLSLLSQNKRKKYLTQYSRTPKRNKTRQMTSNSISAKISQAKIIKLRTNSRVRSTQTESSQSS